MRTSSIQVVLALALGACALPAETSVHTGISGVTLDAQGHPIPHAPVWLTSQTVSLSTISDEEGRFGFDVEPGSYRVSAFDVCCAREDELEVSDGERLVDLQLQNEPMFCFTLGNCF
jgi:hypothetical protein